ncbi:MAG: 4-hydroxythreonine-4-phosphate dehydrogenase PdxA [Candidatus Fervidibacter sp.]|uniref:4-hydroxythreonine-4-phosphate dehydrogenase PdxA n=1 Tax=Candidatus Fervidibacter sp. TaxID=3100871 RepID=UPI00404A92C7
MSTKNSLPRLVLTMGDPNGVGPEIIVKALLAPQVQENARCLVIGSAEVMKQAVAMVNSQMPVRVVDGFDDPFFETSALNVLNAVSFPPEYLTPGQINAASGRAAVQAIELAVATALKGEADAIVTAPIHKAAARQAGMPYAGHTELLKALCGVPETRLMLVCDELRVAHATGHMSLRAAIDSLTIDRIVKTVELALPVLRWLGCENPRIAVASLNPHAGESGMFGDEDEKIVRPAVEKLRERGFQVFGPIPPDTVFWQAVNGGFDLVVALYHDQGHIPVKVLAFDRAVNVTLGLPIIRTSPDHGVALDIAWQNKARATSMKAAILLAAQMARKRKV